MRAQTQARPWYVEPWPWLLMAGPATVIVAGVITVWLAVASNDGLVADDYYKQGLAANQVLSRDAAARTADYRAQMKVDAASGRITVSMNRELPAAQLMLRAVHPTRPGLDLALPLTARDARTFDVVSPPLAAGRWLIVLEDSGRTWRLSGDLHVPGTPEVELVPRQE